MNTSLHILLVQLYSNGDCLYATTVARQIKKDFPGCRLSWLIAGYCSDIISMNPFVDEVLVTEEVKKNDITAFRRLKRRVYREKKDGKWDEVFITHNMDNNLAWYDGTIRGMILRAYPKPITVPVDPVLIISEIEKERVRNFAEKNRLQDFKNVILWEFAPQSGQSSLHFDFVKKMAEKITEDPGTCVLLTSAISFTGSERLIDASSLTVRENAALTHYCTLLIGCSSGITWISTSSAARQLPMIQLLDPGAFFRNAPSLDFERYGIPSSELIELYQFDEKKILRVVSSVISKGISESRVLFNEQAPVQFNTTRKIVYNLLCYAQFGALVKHYRVTRSVYGRHPLFLKQYVLGILTFPFQLISNKWRKWVG